MKLWKFLSICCVIMFASVAFAQQVSTVDYPQDNATMDARLATIKADPRVVAVIQAYGDNSTNRFAEHMEMTRISSPSRQEYWRVREVARRLKNFGFTDAEIVNTSANFNTATVTGGGSTGSGTQVMTHSIAAGTKDISAINRVDGLPVWQTCAIIKSPRPDTDFTGNNFAGPVFTRHKVIIEGHFDTVNPAEIDAYMTEDAFGPNGNKFNTADLSNLPYDKVRLQPLVDGGQPTSVIMDRAELAALTMTLKFDDVTNTIQRTGPEWEAAVKQFDNASDARANGGYRIYVPGYSDAMNNSTQVYWMAKLFKEYKIKPAVDTWFCLTAGEEGRGNIAGMKQLYGYNQQFANADPALNGKNSLNIIANLSIDGGFMGIHYLGSFRYESNYYTTALAEGTNANAAMAAARSIAGIAKLTSPSEDNSSQPKTTYTVGYLYQKDGDGSDNTSFETDMRSPKPDVLILMQAKITPWFQLGANLESAAVNKPDAVKYAELWYGDRPAHWRSDALMRTDPLIYAAWKSYDDVFAPAEKRKLPQYPADSSSLNDNIPGAMNIPSVNMNIGATAGGGGGHAFYEWGTRGALATEIKNFTRVVYTLLLTTGMMDAAGTSIVVPCAYALTDVAAPRHMDGTIDNWFQADVDTDVWGR